MSNKVAKGFRSPKVSFLDEFKNKKEQIADKMKSALSKSAPKSQRSQRDIMLETFEKHLRKAFGKLETAMQNDDKVRIASAYSDLLDLHFQVFHPGTPRIAKASIAAAIEAYGSLSQEHGEELSTLSMYFELINKFKQARKLRDEALDIFEKTSSVDFFVDALDHAITMEGKLHEGAKIKEHAQRGMKFVEAKCKPGSEEYKDHMAYFQEMMESAFDDAPPTKLQRALDLINMAPMLAGDSCSCSK